MIWNGLFGKYLGLYERIYYHNKQEYRKDVDKVIKFLPSLKNARILDVGCGTGKHALELMRRGFRVECIDISKEAVEATKKSLKGYKTKILKADIAGFNQKESYSAMIALFIVLSYLQTKNQFKKAIKNAFYYLEKGEVLFFDVVNGVQLEKNFEKSFKFKSGEYETEWVRKKIKKSQKIFCYAGIRKKGKTILKEKQVCRYYFPKEIKEVLSGAGFKKIKFFSDLGKNKDLRKPRTRLFVSCIKP